MKVLIDTSVLISAMLPDHVHHAEAHAWLACAKTDAVDFIVSGHSLAEAYSVLTRLPRTPRIGRADAAKLIQENVSSHASVVTLAGDDYVNLIEDLAQAGVTGGAVYDALIAKATELAGVDHLLTLNVSHFQQVCPAGANRVISPLSMSPPAR